MCVLIGRLYHSQRHFFDESSERQQALMSNDTRRFDSRRVALLDPIASETGLIQEPDTLSHVVEAGAVG